MGAKSVFDRITCDDERLLLLNELERELLEDEFSSKADFKDPWFCGEKNEATLQAEFYHFCKTQQIPCYLEVMTEYGILDAVIVFPIKIIIEFKIVKSWRNIKNLYKKKRTDDQFLSYLKSGFPLVIITNKCDFSLLMSKIQSTILKNNLYYYNQDVNDIVYFIYRDNRLYSQG